MEGRLHPPNVPNASAARQAASNGQERGLGANKHNNGALTDKQEAYDHLNLFPNR
jgi:hypothetical protein